jgi:DNA-binding NtrC family response regulator
MPDTDGVTLLKEWAGAGLLNMPVIMMSGHATIDTAVQATRIGAMAFLEKPITMQKLLKAVEQGLNRKAPASAPPIRNVPSIVPVPSMTAYSDSDSDESDAPIIKTLTTAAPTLPQALHAMQTFDLNHPLREARDNFEKAYFEYHLAQEGGSMTRVAEKTGLERTHLYRKLKQLGVDLSRGKRNS